MNHPDNFIIVQMSRLKTLNYFDVFIVSQMHKYDLKTINKTFIVCDYALKDVTSQINFFRWMSRHFLPEVAIQLFQNDNFEKSINILIASLRSEKSTHSIDNIILPFHGI